MLVILEGVDGAGKTTLAEEIVRQLGKGDLLHKSRPEQGPIEEYVLPLQGYLPGWGDWVCDRWHLGEEVYGPQLRGASIFDTRGVFHHVEKVLQAKGALLVYLDPGLKTLRSRLQDRGDDLVGVEQLRDLRAGYQHALRRSQVPRLTFDSSLEVETVARMVIEAARHLEELSERLNDFETYIGELHPHYLLLGDVRNGDDPPHDAAFTPGPATSGRYLLEHLPEPVLRGCGIANACEEDVEELWRVLGRPRTVALGVNASRACAQAGIEFGSVPHPQYVRRFHHSSGLGYGELIREVLRTGEDRLKWRP